VLFPRFPKVGHMTSMKVPWDSVTFHSILWFPIGSIEVPSGSTVFHEISGNSLSLSLSFSHHLPLSTGPSSTDTYLFLI